VCAGYQLLGRYYAPAEGPRIQGIEVLDAVTEAGPTRFIGHVAVDCDFGAGNRGELIGFENHSGRTHLGSSAEPLGRVLAGGGNNGEDGTEGARYREVYATYLHGPVLPKNPWLTDHLISRALLRRYRDAGTPDALEALEDQTETEAHTAALRLACRPSGRRRAATAALPRWWRAGSQRPAAVDQAAGDDQAAAPGMAWTSR
jgi:CobQ-like glutamine amidotransferase family enzyme